MKAVVFGGAGFLGSHVADTLTDEDYDVTIFDITDSKYLQKGQEMIVGDILDEKAVGDAVAGADVVYNFAGIADLREAKKKPIETAKINIVGNTVVLEACRKAKVKRFVFASSVYVYSEAGSFYRSSKQACELIIENYNSVFGLPFTILRYGSLYGPRADERNWIFQILKQAVTEAKITRDGDGEELREYIHVKDAAKCSVDILTEDFEDEYIMITGSQRMRVKDLLIMIKEIMGNKIDLEFLPTDSDLHYQITPYSFNPKIAKKYVTPYSHDIGQGILEILSTIYQENFPYEKKNGLYYKE